MTQTLPPSISFPGLSGSVVVSDDGALWTLSGEIDAAVQDEFEATPPPLRTAAQAPRTIDLGAVTFMDCGGLRVLGGATRGGRHRPALRNVPACVALVLDVSRSRTLFAAA